MRASLLVTALLLCTGCAETIHLHCTSHPPGARIAYRVGSQANPGQPRTDWQVIGVTPFVGDVVMHPEWAAPGAVLELRLDMAGHHPEYGVYSPGAILTDHRLLRTDNFVLGRVPAKPAKPAAPAER